MEFSPLLLMLVAVFSPAVAGVVSMLLPREATGARTLTALAGPLLSVAALLLFADGNAIGGVDPAAMTLPFVPTLHLNFVFNPDELGFFFAMLVAGVGTLIVLYARAYFGKDEASLFRFFPTLGFFATAMLGLVLSDNMLAMLLFWEMTSVSSFLLIGWERNDRKSVRLAIQALTVTGLGGLGLLGGIILLGLATGEWSFSGAVAAVASSEGLPAGHLLPWAFGLLFLGGATKSAQWPFHFWLPGAMSAPTPVSAYLHSATMVKAGVYLFGRLTPAFAGVDYWIVTLIVIGAATMLLGAWFALRSVELKQIFAYTTVSQLGLFTCMYGLGGLDYHHDPNLIWPVTQILNHALYKAPLFLMAGAIAHTIGRKKLPELKGLLREQPLLAWITLAAAYALAAGPFTLSFTAKEAFLYQVYHAIEWRPWVWAIAAMAVLTAVCNVAIFIRFVTTFMASPEPAADAGHDHAHHHGERDGWSLWLWAPAALLVVWQFVGGIAPGFFQQIVQPIETHTYYWETLPTFIHAVTHPSPPLYMSGVAVALGVLIGFSPIFRKPLIDPHNGLFPASVSFLGRTGWGVFASLQTGNIRHYVYFMMTALLLGLVASTLHDPDFLRLPEMAMMTGAPPGFMVAALSLFPLVCIATLSLPMFKVRVIRVLILGAVGMSVTGLYLLYQAPDLALTQLMFEIISIILFLLALRMLPEEPPRVRMTNALGRGVFSAVVGLAIGWLVLHAGSFVDSQGGAGKLGEFFLAHAYEGTEATNGRGGGGFNVVNVILVDFRGYDTLGEITVLAIAAIGIFSLISSAPRSQAERAWLTDPARLSSSLFRTSMRLILPLSLLFAAYMFFKGHNEPGGGFVAGLIASVALAVFRMAKGPEALKQLLPIKPGALAAVGLLIAMLTAVAPLTLGYPLLTSHTGYIPLAGSDPYHYSTVMFFDLGVMIVVVAASVGVINRLTEELET